VKIKLFLTILPALLMGLAYVPLNLSDVDSVFAQSDNTLSQEGEGDNQASQTDSSSQETNQNSMCVSGEITSLSCNNLSSENADSQAGDDKQKPLSIQGKIYQKSNTDADDEANLLATVSCEPGDTAISSNFKLDGLMTSSRGLSNTLDISNNQATVEFKTVQDPFSVTVYINCFDNP
jgi:hypothetical protein